MKEKLLEEMMVDRGPSLVVQWLKLHISTSGDTGLIPDQGTKILYSVWCGQK